MSDDEDPSKFLLPYLNRAKELDKLKPRISHYCRLYALKRGLEIPPRERTRTTHDILDSLMGQLDKDKNYSKWSPEDEPYVAHFAMNVFMEADKQDRTGRANLKTAKTFYAACLFMEILHGFGEVQSDLEQKQKYAAWRAAEIRKAVIGQKKHASNSKKPESCHLEGQGDEPPSKGASEKAAGMRAEQSSSEDSESEVWEDASSSLFEIDASSESDAEVDGEDLHSKAYVDPVHWADVDVHQSPDCIVTVPTTWNSLGTTVNHSYDRQEDSGLFDNKNDIINDDPATVDLSGHEPRYIPSAAKIAEAHKVAKLAVSALAFDDVPSACSYLEQALHLLTIPK